MVVAAVETKEYSKQLVAADPVHWAVSNKIRVIGGIFGLINHEYQADPMQSTARRKCYMKGTKGGWTELEVLETLHGMIHGHYPSGVLYAFPTSDTVSDFSKGRFKPLIDYNPAIKAHVRDTDSASVKRVGQAFLYLRGARLSEVIEAGTKESSKLKDIIVDKFVADECDHMSETAFEKMRGRLMHSKVRKEVYVSNPVLPDSGIHAQFKKSDQRQWFRHCSSCGEWTCAELEFPSCVKVRKDGSSYIGCKKCGKPVGISPGQWVAAYPQNDYMEGYQLSHLTSAYIEPKEVLDAFNDPPEGNLADVYRLRLGLPYVDIHERLTQAQVFSRCGNEVMWNQFAGPSAMGVDVGNTLYVVIGYKPDRFQKMVVKVCRLEGPKKWDDLHLLAQRFGVKSAVVDLKPEGHSAKKFRNEARYVTFLCDYSDTAKLSVQYNQETGVVIANRTDICDISHKAVVDEELILPRRSQEIDIFAAQMANMAKSLEEDKRTGTKKYRYRALNAGKPASGDDHYRHATNYFLLACRKIGYGAMEETKKRQTQQVSEYYV